MKVGRREFLKLAGSAMAGAAVPVRTKANSGNPSWRPVRNVFTRVHLIEPLRSEDQGEMAKAVFPRTAGKTRDVPIRLPSRILFERYISVVFGSPLNRYYVGGRSATLDEIAELEASFGFEKMGISSGHIGGYIDTYGRWHELPLGEHVCIAHDRGSTRFYTDGKPGIGKSRWDKLDTLLEPEERGTREPALKDVYEAFEQIECPDPSNYGKFITIGTVGEMHTGIWRKPHGK